MLDDLLSLDPSRVPSSDPLHATITDLLIDEAMLLDHDRFHDWSTFLAEDIVYTMPVRQALLREQGPGFDDSMGHFDEDHASLMLKIKRYDSKSNWAEDPPSRVKRFVTNVVVRRTEVENEYDVSSYLLLVRNRWDNPTFDLVPAVRDDRIRRTASGWKLARRTILIEQSCLGTPNLAVLF
jgi:3-phenylpropionate/cinnamic acid dioxygenase small subunit